ncbi:MAG: 50S ribosomal protein L9 [Gammaproteobacteria bacterium]|nr:50S ribosomal protein L9 [Gammaproteobacteria bacterium]|tara:strand:+ start:4035 stop:4484 length:450 start_codon:yes stop_codon:yes gene_type:complete
MEIILLEKVNNLGDPGDLVKVKPGYARNFLVPLGKAVVANEDNKAEYEERKVKLLEAEEERKSLAQELAKKLNELEIYINVSVSEEGTLYGSIGTREIAEAVNSLGVDIEKGSIRLPEGTLKELGDYKINVQLHPEVIQEISVTIKAEE